MGSPRWVGAAAPDEPLVVAPPVVAAAVAGPQTAPSEPVAPALVAEPLHVVVVHPTPAEVVPEVAFPAATAHAAETGLPAVVEPHTPDAAVLAGNLCPGLEVHDPLVAPGIPDAGSPAVGSPGRTHTPAADVAGKVAPATLHPACGVAAPDPASATGVAHPWSGELGCYQRCGPTPAACCPWLCPL